MGFFQGIYGFDFLSIFLLLLSAILNFWRPTAILGLLLFLIVVFRTFSKNIYRRRNEDYKFREWANKFLKKLGLTIPDNLPPLNSSNLSLLISRLRYSMEQRKKYKTVICPGCHKKFKIPRGRGKIIVTCKTCFTEFKAKV